MAATLRGTHARKANLEGQVSTDLLNHASILGLLSSVCQQMAQFLGSVGTICEDNKTTDSRINHTVSAWHRLCSGRQACSVG